MRKIEKIAEFKKVTYEKKNQTGIKNTVIKNINLSINRGEFLALLGSNGCGKSTLAKHFNGLLLPSSGDVFIKGINTKDESQNYCIKKNVGMIFQNPDNQIVAPTVEEEIAFGLENLCIPQEKMAGIIEKSLAATGLHGFEKKPTYSLSGGQKQRLAVASVLAMEPEIMVLDEPTSMLDPEGRQSLLSTLSNLNKNNNITIVLITHYTEEALLANRTLIMDKGEIITSGNPRKIFSNIKLMNSMGFNPLDSTRILYYLKNKGYDVALDAFTSAECSKEIIKLLETS